MILQHELPIIAFSKGKNRNAGDETFFHENRIIKFKKNDSDDFFFKDLEMRLTDLL